MTDSPTYNVVLSGELLPGYETATVVDAFVRIFKLSPEKAISMVGTHRVIEKEVELQVAKTYQKKLRNASIVVFLYIKSSVWRPRAETPVPTLEPSKPEANDPD